MSKIYVIYHRADFDGIFSREIAKRFFGDRAEYIGWDYGDPLPAIDIEDTSLCIYMIDISVDAWMGHPGVTWIDHHKSAIEKYSAHVGGLRIDGVAACRLAWQWFFGKKDSPKSAYVDRAVDEPFAVTLAGEYDIWDKRDPAAELFQHGLRSCDVDFQRLLHREDLPFAAARILSNSYVRELLEGGRVLQFARTKENASIIRAQGFTILFEGLTFLACNAARYNSHLFTAGLQPEHDARLGFKWDGGKQRWSVSMYGVPGKPDVDVSVIAVRYGGGGHKQACGFECLALPFVLGGAS